MDSKMSLIGVNDLASVLLQCFALILVGYLSGRLGLITEKESKGLSAFVTYFSLPALIFQSLSTSDLSNINWYFVLSIFTSKTLVFISVAIITAILTKPSNLGKSGLFAIFCTQSNDFALGYPLLAALYGKTNQEFTRYLYILAPIQLVVLNPIGLFFMEIHRHIRTQTIRSNYFKIFLKVLKQIIKNPIIFMTFFGIVWNLSFGPQIPILLKPLFEVLSNSFSATALFLLGLNLLGKFKTFAASSHLFLLSLVLVMTKILILPLLNRVIIQNVMTSENNQTLELSNFGFLYGTFPSAPTVFIFALQYEFGMSSTVVSTGMVMSTVLSAPLMFVSANMIRLTNNTLPVTAFHSDLGQTMSYSSIISILCVIWTLIVLICGHKWKSLTHRCTIALAVSQLMIGIGGYLWSYIDDSESKKYHHLIYHIQYVLAVGGVISSRIWTAMLSLTLALLQWKNLCYVIKIHLKLSYFSAFLTFILLLIVICLPNNPDSDLIDPNFEFGTIQAYIAVIVLICCLIVTIVGLIIQQHFRSRLSYYHSLRINSEDLESEDIENIENIENNEQIHQSVHFSPNNRRGRFRTLSNPTFNSEEEHRSLIEVEEMGASIESRHLCQQQSCSQERRKSCMSSLRRYRGMMSEASEVIPLIHSSNLTSEAMDDFHQLSHHIFLSLTLLVSMFIGLTVSIGKLIMEKPTGIFIELEFLDILLNYGQGVITFLLFGLEMTPVFSKIMSLLLNNDSMNNCIVLPPIESIRAETRGKCEQFIAFHKQNCIRDIVFEHQINGKLCHVFRGKDLVDWLLTTGISNNRNEAESYGQHLLIGRILEYVCEKQNFNPKEYELHRNNKPLDLSLTIRFANIPNNGTLELRKSNAVRKDQKVTIALELENGTRQINEFDSTQSLWQIINCLYENNPILKLENNKQLSIIYVTKEIAGENQLKETNLRNLGLLEGRAAMKLLVKPIDAVKEQAFVESLDLRKFAKESKDKKDKEITSNQLQPKQVSTDVPLIQSKPSPELIVDTIQSNTIEMSGSNAEVMQIQESNETNEESENIQEMEVSSDESSDEEIEVLNYLGGNHFEILFKISNLSKVSKDFSDEFYKHTKEDLMHVLNDLKRQQETDNNNPLMTNQMREQMSEQRKRDQMNRYNATVIRVCFPNDKLVLQAVFKPTDTVEDIKKVIRRYTCLDDFYLFTSPPKCILNEESTLFDSKLVPAALIRFGSNSDTPQNVIKEEFKSKTSSYKSALKVAEEARPKSVADTSGQTSQTPQQTENPNSGKKKNLVPKWFKMN